jgi:hypothetical protein
LSRCPSLAFVVALASLAAPARPDAALDVAGAVAATSPRLAVRVTLTNRGDRPAGPIDVRGELFGEPQAARLAGTLAPHGSGSVTLEFATPAPKPGLHALTLLVEHPLEGAPDGAGNPAMASQRAFLLLALGASPGPAVRMRADPLRLDVRGSLAVHLESADGEARRVRLRALTARGIRSEGGPIDVDVPAKGELRTVLPVARAGAARGTEHALLLVAETPDLEVSRTAVAAANVVVAADPSWLPRLRTPLLGLGITLLAFALGFEIWKASRPGHRDSA